LLYGIRHIEEFISWILDPQWSWATIINKGRPIWLHHGAVQWSNSKRHGTICATRNSPLDNACGEHILLYVAMCFIICWGQGCAYIFSRNKNVCCQVPHMEEVFFIQDRLHPSWRVVLQKEPRSRRVVDNNDEQILGISEDLSGL